MNPPGDPQAPGRDDPAGPPDRGDPAGPPDWISTAHQVLVEHAPVGFAILDRQLRYVEASRSLAELDGVTVEERLGRTVREVAPEVADLTEGVLRKVLRSGRAVHRLRLFRSAPTGPARLRHWMVSICPVPGEDGEVAGLTVAVRDLTDATSRLPEQPVPAQVARWQAERHAARAHLLQQLTAELAATTDLQQVADVVQSTAAATLLANACVIAEVGQDRICRIRAATGLNRPADLPWQEFPADASNMITMLLDTRQPVLIASGAERDLRLPQLRTLGGRCQAWALLPLVADARPVGIAAFGWREARRFPREEVDLLVAVATQTAIAMERARLFEAERRALAEAHRAQGRLALLAEASARISTAQTEEGQLTALAELLIGGFADVCAVLMPDAAGQLHRRIVRASNPDWMPHLQALQAAPVPMANDGDARMIAWRTGQVARELIEDISPYIGTTGTEETGAMARVAGVSTSIAAPLVARGQILGVFNVWRNHQRDCAPDDDGQFLADLGRRAGMAVDNARQLAERTRIATSLQQTLLPYRLPEIPGVELAPTYLAADGSAEVGGDLYDVYPSGAGGYALVIGDVAGRGLDAAGLTGTARATLRALAPDLPVAAALARLDSLLAEQSGDTSFLTLAHLLLDPVPCGAALSVWLAGHPPPLLVHPDGTVVELGEPRPPLGVASGLPPVERRYLAGAGDLLLLYTDGLTETRGAAGRQFGDAVLPRLLRALAGCSAEEAASRLRRAVLAFRTGRSDDIAFLVARFLP